MLLAVLAGIGFSFAADPSSPLINDNRWQEARKSLADGKAAEARATFEELLKQYPQDADLHLFLGISLLRLREPHAAEAAVKKALSIDPNHVEARTLMGWIDSEIAGTLRRRSKNIQKWSSCAPICLKLITISGWPKSAREI